MATLAACLTQDQNSNVDFDGSLVAGKNSSKARNDISKSAKPSALQASKKLKSSNEENADFPPNDSHDHQNCIMPPDFCETRRYYIGRKRRNDGSVSLETVYGIEETPGVDSETEKQPELSSDDDEELDSSDYERLEVTLKQLLEKPANQKNRLKRVSKSEDKCPKQKM